uniref:Uncharacterized protein n=1 Tax=Pristionchus pacificus TaxID=54126 RepID=A0A2A6BT61_PRIPA|eukprot:PDM69162.1 hypothetical protein PRIPAC_47464 [Pristionchus pacificus]
MQFNNEVKSSIFANRNADKAGSVRTRTTTDCLRLILHFTRPLSGHLLWYASPTWIQVKIQLGSKQFGPVAFLGSVTGYGPPVEMRKEEGRVTN